MKDRFFRVFGGYVSCIGLIVITYFIFGVIFPETLMSLDLFILIIGITVLFSIPAIIYSFLMEFVINPKISRSYWGICISVFFWIITVGVFFSGFTFISLDRHNLILSLRTGIGGLLSGIWIRYMYVREIKGQQVPSWFIFILIFFICFAVIGLLVAVILLLIIAFK